MSLPATRRAPDPHRALFIETVMHLIDQEQPWHAEAACRDAPLGLFFPSRGQSLRPARKLCRGCPVRAECLNYALERELEGIWGGTTLQERRRMVRGRERP